tara:strand:- start:3572 stop:3868 length:297 start_codon:yes stop_codon:yes gene_type:complete
MPFKKGNTLSKGRPKGAINRSTEMAKLTLARIADEGLDNLKKDLQKIREKDPVRAAELYLKILEYIIPKQQRVEVKGEIEQKIQQITVNINKNDGNND